MIVVDASAAISGLLNDGPARKALAKAQVHVPCLIDSQIAHVIRRRALAGSISGAAGWAALSAWQAFTATRYPLTGLLWRVWELRENLSAFVAGYVALAEALDCPLLTADSRIAGAPGLEVAITTVPR